MGDGCGGGEGGRGGRENCGRMWLQKPSKSSFLTVPFPVRNPMTHRLQVSYCTRIIKPISLSMWAKPERFNRKVGVSHPGLCAPPVVGTRPQTGSQKHPPSHTLTLLLMDQISTLSHKISHFSPLLFTLFLFCLVHPHPSCRKQSVGN